MKDFIEDFWPQIFLIIMFIVAIFLFTRYIDTQNEQRLAIINNKMVNVVKYDLNHCQNIDNYYYCWSDSND